MFANAVRFVVMAQLTQVNNASLRIRPIAIPIVKLSRSAVTALWKQEKNARERPAPRRSTARLFLGFVRPASAFPNVRQKAQAAEMTGRVTRASVSQEPVAQ